MKTYFTAQQSLPMCLKWLFLWCLAGAAAADPIDDAEDVPATVGEIQFIDAIVGQVKASVPAIDGWEREISVTASRNTVREGQHPIIFERARDYPLRISVRVDFERITEADRQRAVEEKSAQELQQEMMAAAMSGDTRKMDELQKQLAALMQSQMTAGPMGQAVGVSSAAPSKKPSKFYVQVIVNGDGENIGNKYDIAVRGVAKAFRLDKGNDDYLGYKYYLGAWDISELDASNWRIVFPQADQTPANHLRALVLLAHVYGDRDNVEDYNANSLDLAGLGNALD
ncbi:MAG: hypothetical protein ACE5FV_12355 [Woeseia sp.]